jgi:hypothetical protein
MEPFSDDSDKIVTRYFNGRKWVDYEGETELTGLVLYWSDFNVYNWAAELGPGWFVHGKTPQSAISEAERLALEAAKKAIDDYNLIKTLSQNYNNES